MTNEVGVPDPREKKKSSLENAFELINMAAGLGLQAAGAAQAFSANPGPTQGAQAPADLSVAEPKSFSNALNTYKGASPYVAKDQFGNEIFNSFGNYGR